ncbi:hypothetical protein HYV88_01890 [Candidatus Woesearchaeota archaeon]|nr:hypothetical protein [Candidatus Woesearchaeota archaeon]
MQRTILIEYSGRPHSFRTKGQNNREMTEDPSYLRLRQAFVDYLCAKAGSVAVLEVHGVLEIKVVDTIPKVNIRQRMMAENA